MLGIDVLVEYPAGRACAALVELLYAEPVPAGIVVAEKGGKDGMMRQQSMTRPRSLTGQHDGPEAAGARPLAPGR
jgi:hypothetical protein